MPTRNQNGVKDDLKGSDPKARNIVDLTYMGLRHLDRAEENCHKRKGNMKNNSRCLPLNLSVSKS